MARRRRRHYRRHHNPIVRAVNPISHGEEMTLAVLGVAAVAGGVWWYMTRYTLTLASGSQTLKVPVGTSFTLKLPSGGTWVALASAGGGTLSASAPSGSTPAVLVSAAGMIINATWTLNGVGQNSTITITQ
jgi:hypothetical protein